MILMSVVLYTLHLVWRLCRFHFFQDECATFHHDSSELFWCHEMVKYY